MKLETRKFFYYGLPPILWMGVITTFSTDAFSSEHTGGVLETILASLSVHLSAAQFETIHFLIRKSAHITEYAILALLFFRAFRNGRAGWRTQWARQAWALCIVMAALDEFHQRFVPSRGSSPVDVAIDACGALVALALVWLFSQRKQLAVGS